MLGDNNIGLLVKDPRGADCDSGKAFLELFPGPIETRLNLCKDIVPPPRTFPKHKHN